MTCMNPRLRMSVPVLSLTCQKTFGRRAEDESSEGAPPSPEGVSGR